LKQEHDIDSIKDIIANAEHDTVIINQWVAWDNIIYFSNPELDLILNKKIDSLCDKNLEQSLNNIEKVKFQNARAQALNIIGGIYYNKANHDEAINYYNKSLTLSDKIGNKRGIANTLYNIGIIYFDKGDQEKAISSYTKSLEMCEEIENKKGIAQALNSIGVIYAYQGNHVKAIKNYTQSLKIAEEIGFKKGIASYLKNIGLIYYDQGDFVNALDYYNQSLEIKREIGNQSSIASALNSIGIIYFDQRQFDKAFNYYEESYLLSKEVGDKKGIAGALQNMGMIYFEQIEYDSAMSYFNQSIDISISIDDKIGEAGSLTNIANIYKEKEDFRLALESGEASFQIAQKSGAILILKDAALLLWEVNKTLGNYKNSLDMHELYTEIKDSISSDENHQEVLRQEFKYKYEKQSVADSIVNAEAEKTHLANLSAEKALGEKQKTEIEAQKKQNVFLFVGLGLLALFGFFIYNRFKVTQKQKGIIEKQKSDVEVQKTKVETTLKELKSTHEQLEESHKEITDSINYAERIQRSFLATKESLDTHLKDYFVFFKPKEAVSGDFYWGAELNDNNFAFTVADSTGHGVPGAIMSLLNISSLEKSIETVIEPHKILNKTREIIVDRLSKDGSEHGGKDGMDCNLMVLNKDRSLLTFASANNTIIIIRDGEILEYKGDKMPVGKHDRDTESFTLHSVQLQKGDVIYALTDGFPDQFGGPKGKKYMIKNLKNKFLQIAHMPMAKQEENLSEEFANWMAENEQIDDVCIIGVRV
jgi:serine phosphatase RsbU (regulator of sigma subunit)/Tfp pilus assembly protein PilF